MDEVESLRSEVERLKLELSSKCHELECLKRLSETQDYSGDFIGVHTYAGELAKLNDIDKLTNNDIARYSRQLILPEIGVKGQIALRQTSVLIVGAGGLGCPAAIYLAAAGVGRIGVVDYDEVELSNLHRQILHSESRIGMLKCASISTACHRLNSSVDYVPYHLALDSTNAMDIIKNYDIVLDASDNVATRYLLNDACVLCCKPLVSGSALRFEGQMTVYNYGGGPCYRCLFPKPPPPETVTNCSDGGVLGVVPGIIGSMQALEAIKIACGIGTVMNKRLLLFDGLDATFRIVKLRSRSDNCDICSKNATIRQLVDYEMFCGAKATDKAYSERINDPHILVDVREPGELEICCLPARQTINIPIGKLERDDCIQLLRQSIKNNVEEIDQRPFPVYVVCRRGNDSQIGVKALQKALEGLPITLKDITGGLHAWSRKVDVNFPIY